MFPTGFWDSPIWKEAARAGLRQISQMVSKGNIAGASRLATTPGVLKPSAAGSQIRHLGRGGEGLSTLVAHPEHGVAARKLYDPAGFSTPAMIQRKEEAGRALGDNPHFAKFLGSAKAPSGGSMHFSEYVPSSSPMPKMREATQVQRDAAAATAGNARAALAQKGYEGHDIRMGNMITDSRTGQNKVIDYFPARTGEMSSHPDRPNMITPTPSGAHLFQALGEQSSNAQLLGNTLGKPRPGPVAVGHGPLESSRPGDTTSVLKPAPAQDRTAVMPQSPQVSAARPTNTRIGPAPGVTSPQKTEVLKPAAPVKPISRTVVGVPRAPL